MTVSGGEVLLGEHYLPLTRSLMLYPQLALGVLGYMSD